MALPILPLLLLGGAAVVMLSSSKPSSSSQSSKFYNTELYTDDSAYVCLVFKPNPSDTGSSFESSNRSIELEFDAKVDIMEKQERLNSMVNVVAFVKGPSVATELCSSMSKQYASVPGQAAIVKIIDISSLSGDMDMLCSFIHLYSRGALGPTEDVTRQECDKFFEADYSGMVAVLSDVPGGIVKKKFFILNDGSFELLYAESVN